MKSRTPIATLLALIVGPLGCANRGNAASAVEPTPAPTATANSPKAATPPPTPAEPQPQSPPAAAATTPPEDWAPRPLRKAPALESIPGPDAFYALAGPFGDLDERTSRLARRFADGIDAPLIAEVEQKASVSPMFYGWEGSFRHGIHALALATAEGWLHTPPLAQREKNYPCQRVGPVAKRPVVLGPDGLEATEYTVTYEAGYQAGPFTLKLVCLGQPTPSCTRPWLARAHRGGNTNRTQVVFDTSVDYPGDGAIQIDEVVAPHPKFFRAQLHAPQRPPPLHGTFRPFEAP